MNACLLIKKWVSVTNPWTGAWVHIERDEVTAEKMDAMAQLMEDDIREELHRECPDDPSVRRASRPGTGWGSKEKHPRLSTGVDNR